MNDLERKQRLELLQQQADIYDKLHASGSLSSADLQKYLAVLKEIDRLREIEKCRWDIMRFAKRYFNNGRIMKPETPNPPFHYTMADLICEEINAKDRNSFVAIVAPRSHAKSMIGTVISIIYATVYKIHDYFVLISNKQDVAKQLLSTIKYELMNNEDLIRDFGEMYNKSSWSMMEIVTANGVKIQAAGSGDALRGLNHLGSRPWIWCDDIEKDPDVNSVDYRDKIHDWFNSVVVPLGSPTPGGTKIIWVGTILHLDSVLNRVMKNDTRFKSKRFAAIQQWPERMDLWDEWGEILNRRDFPEAQTEDEAAQMAGKLAQEFYETHREEMDRGAVVLWPERMSLYDLMVIRQSNRKSFLTEYQGDPRDESTVLFNTFHYYEPSEVANLDEFEIVGAVDPSLGKNNRSDYSAIVTVGKHRRTGIMYVLDVDAKRRPPDKIIEDIIEKARHYRYSAFGVETVQFQHLFMTDLKKRCALEGVHIPIREIKPNSDKWLRIASLEPLVTNGFIRFLRSQRDIIEEFQEVTTSGGLGRFDDKIDACEMAVSLIKKDKRRIPISSL